MESGVLKRLVEADRESVRRIIELRGSGVSPEPAVAQRVKEFQRLTGAGILVPLGSLSRELWAGSWWQAWLIKQGYGFFLAGDTEGGMIASLRELAALRQARPLPAEFPVPWPPPHDQVRRDLAVTVADTWERLRPPQGRVLLETAVYVSNRGDAAQEAVVAFTAVWDPVKVVPLPMGASVELHFEWEGEAGNVYMLSAAVHPVQGDVNPDNNYSSCQYTIR